VLVDEMGKVGIDGSQAVFFRMQDRKCRLHIPVPVSPETSQRQSFLNRPDSGIAGR
jgi:hypothetical protein